ncbi:DNA-binding response regulator [Streptomyces sp. SID4919]|uniref:helix-turn-helix transcriptional regulator n=1 Tax=unclassified Streptomyces TaxID=2593676 RepID=UPI0008238567|nr:response regulator transcription factor [Streptomyces sp. AmelKG-E11A]MYY07917.1 DNA-binding response regulator [Streptomyces sp. SID4919]SCK06998.1 DNA-binding response regulator, NarL/FixJ family, contains REC and HTH domains [Streptomyces sp. AmelKG-E11A]
MSQVLCDTPAPGGQLVVTTFVRDGVLRLGLRAVLSTTPIVREVRNCGDWNEVESTLDTTPVDILFLHEADYGPGRGVPVDCRRRRPKVLLLLSDAQVREDLLSGPSVPDGFLVEGELTASAVEDALQRTMAGEVPMPTSFTRALLQRVAEPGPSRWRREVSLTGREDEVVRLLAQGLSNKQIARRLGISSHGVKRIVASLLLKLGAPNRTAAVVTALQTGLISY